MFDFQFDDAGGELAQLPSDFLALAVAIDALLADGNEMIAGRVQAFEQWCHTIIPAAMPTANRKPTTNIASAASSHRENRMNDMALISMAASFEMTTKPQTTTVVNSDRG